MSYSLKNEKFGYEIPLDGKPELLAGGFVRVRPKGSRVSPTLDTFDWEVIQNFELPEGTGAVIRAPGSSGSVFVRVTRFLWVNMNLTTWWSNDEMKAKVSNDWKILSPGITL